MQLQPWHVARAGGVLRALRLEAGRGAFSVGKAARLDDLLRIGPTGTNVRDLVLALARP